MKKYNKLLILIFIVIICVFSIVISMYIKEEEDMGNEIIKVRSFNVKNERIEQKLLVEDFEKLKLGSSFEEIQEEIGQPNGWVGAGIMAPFYVLDTKDDEKQKYVVLYFEKLMLLEELRNIIIVDDEKEIGEIQGKE